MLYACYNDNDFFAVSGVETEEVWKFDLGGWKECCKL